MDQLGEMFLAHASLADDEDRQSRRRQLARFLVQALHLRVEDDEGRCIDVVEGMNLDLQFVSMHGGTFGALAIGDRRLPLWGLLLSPEKTRARASWCHFSS